MRSLFVIGMYAAVALFFVWRAETYVGGGGSLLLARLMCFMLALLIASVGLMQGLEQSGTDASSD
jgi:hypothetical protein